MAASAVTLTDGRFSGVLHQAGTGLTPAVGQAVTLLRDGVKVASGVTGEDGRFAIEGVNPGIYAVVAHGKSGVAVVGIEAKAAAGGHAGAAFGACAAVSFSHLGAVASAAAVAAVAAAEVSAASTEQTRVPRRVCCSYTMEPRHHRECFFR